MRNGNKKPLELKPITQNFRSFRNNLKKNMTLNDNSKTLEKK